MGPWEGITLRNGRRIRADGGIRYGADVLKLLPLGADAVLLGRPLIRGAFGGGKDGVALLLNKAGRDCEVGRAPHRNAGRQNVGGAA